MTSITKLIIGGFKSIRDRTEIPIAPITFLFGPNSAGKSAVLAAIQALIERIKAPDRVKYTAVASLYDDPPPIFQTSRVHKRENQEPVINDWSIPVTLGVEICDFPVSEVGPESYGPAIDRADESGKALYYALNGSDVQIEISEIYLEEESRRQSHSVLTVDQRQLLSFVDPLHAVNLGIVELSQLQFKAQDEMPYGWTPGFLVIDTNHPIWSMFNLAGTEERPNRIVEHALHTEDARKQLADMLVKLVYHIRQSQSKYIKSLVRIDGDNLTIRTKVSFLRANIWTPEMFWGPNFNSFEEIWSDKEPDISFAEKRERLDAIELVNFVAVSISALGASILRTLPNCLETGMVSGDRQILQNEDVFAETTFFPLNRQSRLTPDWTKIIGLQAHHNRFATLQRYALWLGVANAAQLLPSDGTKPLSVQDEDFVNRILGSGVFGSRGYRVRTAMRSITTKTLLPRPSPQGDDEDQSVVDDELQLQVQLYLQDANGRYLDFSEVGSGISYVLPILTSLFMYQNSWVAQPELHLHPSAQCEMGDVFIRAFNQGHFSVVETHSEHVLLRVLRRVRQTASGVEIDPELRCLPETVSVLYFDPQSDGSTQVRRLRVTRLGDFKDRWPDGFFEERGRELFDE